MVNSTEKHVIE